MFFGDGKQKHMQLYHGNLSAKKLLHYVAFKALRKEINSLDSTIFLYMVL